jgi:hexosaminidase
MSLIDPHYNDDAVAPLYIVPKPGHVRRMGGHFILNEDVIILSDQKTYAEAALFASQLETSISITVPVIEGQESRGRRIEFHLDPTHESYGSEGYFLQVTPQGVYIVAAELAGLFYASQTLLQLLQKTNSLNPEAEWSFPAVEIQDSPRFPWRGVMLDVARYFMPVDFIKKFINAISLHKINTLQLHLNDDQGWRIEIKKYPKLTSVGAYRNRTLVGFADQSPKDKAFDPAREVFDGVAHGGFYSQDEMRDIVAYALARHVTIVPEIEMPGHAQAAIAAYPELGCTAQQLEVSPRWGIHDNLYKPTEHTFTFLKNVLTEVMDIFPSKFIHVGGDEAVKRQWKESDFCQHLMRELGMSDEEQLQSYFISQFDAFLTEKGRTLIGWDEILQGGLADNAVVMSWRGEKGGITAAKLDHDVVMAPYEYTYFDYYQCEDYKNEPLAFPEVITLNMVYNYEPVPADLPDRFVHHILGAQGQLWTEYMPTTEQVEYMAFPRVCALAEVTWTNKSLKDYGDFVGRLSVHLERLKALGIGYRPLDSVDAKIDLAFVSSRLP